MKRILILGAGNAQVDAIKYCKALGCEVIGCSYTTEDKGIKLLNYFENVDIKDTDSVRKVAIKYGVNLVYSVGSDVAMPTVMKVSEELGLPHFVSSETTEVCLNKDALRERLGRDFSGNSSFVVYKSRDKAIGHDAFPAMMKPTDAQGQRGCFKVETIDDIAKHFNDSLGQSESGKVIVEDYIHGKEISVNAYLHGGKVDALFISDRYVFDEYPGGIVRKHVMPSNCNEDVKHNIRRMTEEVLSNLGIENGPTYLQMKITKAGQPVLIEATPRLDGCHIWKLIKLCYGVDLLDISFRELIEGKTVAVESEDCTNKQYSLEFICREPHELFNKNNHDAEGDVDVCYYYDEGDRVRPINGKLEKCGYVIREKI